MLGQIGRVVITALWGVVIVIICVVAYFAIRDSIQRTDIQKTLIVGKTYQVDRPYPATLKVSSIGNEQWSGAVKGDLFIVLPEGSKEIHITRFFGFEGILYYECSFYIQFLTPEGTTQTLTWQDCAKVDGYLSFPMKSMLSKIKRANCRQPI